MQEEFEIQDPAENVVFSSLSYDDVIAWLRDLWESQGDQVFTGLLMSYRQGDKQVIVRDNVLLYIIRDMGPKVNETQQ